MRYKHPPTEMGASGYYGGVGSKPASPFWTPGADEDAAAPEERVPKRFRRLRLHRTRPRESVSRAVDIGVPLFVFIAAVVLFFVAPLLAILLDLL